MDPTTDLIPIALEAVKAGNWVLAAALALVLAVYLVRTYLSTYLPWLATDRGGALLALVGGIVGAYAHALIAGSPVGLSLALDGLAVGLAAAGGWSTVRRLLGVSAAPGGVSG